MEAAEFGGVGLSSGLVQVFWWRCGNSDVLGGVSQWIVFVMEMEKFFVSSLWEFLCPGGD